jgi:mono/diheme cytochrome c family protein
MRFFFTTLLSGWLIWALPVQADSTLPEKHDCSSCHRFSAEDSLESRIAPDLFYAGNKFQKSWLKKFLQAPVVVRKAGTSTDPDFLKNSSTEAPPHPALSKKEASAMADYLMSLVLPGLSKGKVDDVPLTKGTKVRVKILFERNYGCIACHEGINLAGQARGGISGPSHANAGNRLTADWVFNWLKTPKKFIARGRMPIFNLDDESAVKLTKYIMSLKIGDWN